MNYTELFKKQAKILGVDFVDLPFDIYLVTGSILQYAFIEDESSKFLGLQVTMSDGTEHYHVLPKENIEYIKIKYAESEQNADSTFNKRMYG